MTLTPDDLDRLQLTVRVTAGVSLLAIICIFLELRKTWATLRKSPSRIILWWTISTTIAIPAMLLSRMFVPQSPGEPPSTMCRLQGTLLTFGLLSSILWAGCIAIHLLIAIKWKFDVEVMMNAESIYNMLCWGLPALSSAILFFVPDVYNDAIFWCWIDIQYEWLRMVLINAPSLLTMVSSLIIYALVGREISRTFNYTSHAEGNYLELQRRRMQATNRFALKCSLYLLAFGLSHSGEVALYISLAMSPDTPYRIFDAMAVTIPGGGIFIAVAYFATRLLKSPKGSISIQDSFNSITSRKRPPRFDPAAVSYSGHIGQKSFCSVPRGDKKYLNDSSKMGGSGASCTPTMVSTPSSALQFNEFCRNSTIMPTLPPSVYHSRA